MKILLVIIIIMKINEEEINFDFKKVGIIIWKLKQNKYQIQLKN
jgi:hypothetical protein